MKRSQNDSTGRREFLVRAAGTTLALTLTRIIAAGTNANADRQSADVKTLNQLLDRIFNNLMREEPQSMTSLGLDKGTGAWAKSKLDDKSHAHMQHMAALCQSWLKNLGEIDPARLSGVAATNYATIRYQIELTLRGVRSFSYGRADFPAPYALSQITGAYQHIPDFLDTQHDVADRSDAEAYLARLGEFARVMDEETERARSDGAMGVIPPDFIIDKTLQQMTLLRTTPVDRTTLVTSLARRTQEKGIVGDWTARATKAVSGPVWSALDRQIELLRKWRSTARSDAGVWALPQGDEYYRFATHYQTTTDLSPEEIHRDGLELVAQLSGTLDSLLKQLGSTQGTVGARMAALYKDQRFIYPNTDEGRQQLLDYLNGCVKQVTARLPDYFGTLAKAGLEIRRIPVATEAASPGGYYEDGSLDGSRPGAYYVNLRDMEEVPRWTLPTLTFHEGIPGHHFQGALVLEAAGLPMIRRTLWFTGYGEGWALYAEQLADEMGMYEKDSWGRVGYLHDALFRAVRLVLDSGLHYKRWTRTEAIRYFTATMGDPEASATSEVERYCVWPGQACSYMIGKMTWLRLRSRAQAALGPKFDIRKFHDAGLLSGPMPLQVLDHEIDAWTRKQT